MRAALAALLIALSRSGEASAIEAAGAPTPAQGEAPTPGEAAPPGPAAPVVTTRARYPPVVVRVPVMDLPFNALEGGSFPSMQQSLLLVGGGAQVVHHGLFRLFDSWLPPFWRRPVSVVAVALADLLLMFPTIWMHEEWHRAVMTQWGISSHNDVYDLRIVSGTIAVSHVQDADLIRLKRNHPADMVRLSSAGMESELELTRLFQKSGVFHATPALPDLILALYSVVSVVAYRQTCATRDSDLTTDAINAAEGANVAVRDFTGLDCDAWVYDLHRPTEPYEARGVHPSGVGVDRYIRYSDLTAEEQRVMRQVRNLGLLNFVSPYLFGFGRFRATSPLDGQPFHWNAALRHHLTSYGHDLTVDVYLARERLNLLLAYHHGMNSQSAFPGLEAEVVRFPVRVGEVPMHLSGAVMAWLQPEAQSFLTRSAQLGGLARARLDVPVAGTLDLSFELEAKSEGFVAGVVELQPALAFRGGVVWRY